MSDNRVQVAEYLLGYPQDAPNNWRFSNWSKSRRRLVSPLSHWLGEVNRFSLDLGPVFDLPGVEDTDPRQALISQITQRTRGLLYTALERGSITGAVYWFFRPDPTLGYQIYLYDECEVEAHEGGYRVQVRTAKGWARSAFTPKAYETYKTVTAANNPWVLEGSQPHPYLRVPGVRVANRVWDHAGTPRPTFDWPAIEMAMEICSQTLSAAANYTYFGGPFLVSGDPKATLQELMNRTQVLSGRVDQESQDTGLLNMPAMPGSHQGFMDSLMANFCSHTGISWVPPEPPGDTSSLTLRLLYSRTVNTANAVRDNYILGYKAFLEKILQAAALDGQLVGVSADPATFTLELSFREELFPLTPQEKQATLMVVEQLQALGIAPEVALKEYYTSLNTDEILERMVGS